MAYAFVVQQVRDELNTGRLTEEKIGTLAEVSPAQPYLVPEASFRRGVAAEFVRRVEYSPAEGLALLLEAARRAVIETTVMAALRRSHVRVSERGNVPDVSLGVRPGIHHGIRANERRVLMIALRAVVPLPPEPIEIRVMQPEDGIRWRNGSIRHGAAHPDVHATVYSIDG